MIEVLTVKCCLATAIVVMNNDIMVKHDWKIKQIHAYYYRVKFDFVHILFYK